MSERRTIRRYATGDVMGDGIITRIDCPESECPTCTKPNERTTDA